MECLDVDYQEIRGKELIKKICLDNGLNCDEILILGTGKKAGKKRCEYDIGTRNKETKLFAIKYFECEELYIAWNLKNPNVPSKKNIFSIKTVELSEISLNRINLIEKNNQFSGWGKEVVYVFKSNMAEQFIKEYVLNRAK